MSNRLTIPDAQTRLDVEAIVRQLPPGALVIAGVETPVPEAVSEAIRTLLHDVAAGHSVHIRPNDGEVSPNEAAAMLGMSRGTVTRLMATGALPFRLVGTHRRIPTAAVLEHERRIAAFHEMVRLDQEMGLYDLPPMHEVERAP
jgi:excisionase family DNA binding protein